MNDSLDDAVADIYNRKPIILYDEENEQQGDFVLAAEKIKPIALNTLARHGNDMLCVVLEQARLEQLGLQPQPRSHLHNGCSMCTTVDHRGGYGDHTLGSKYNTIHALLAQKVPITHESSLLQTPGHIIPLCIHPQGLGGRQGHTEGADYLMQLAGLPRVGVLTEVMDREAEEVGPMHGDKLKIFAREHRLTMVTMRDLINHYTPHQ